MKCERCGFNDATVYYRSTVNGRTAERHLCADCARELGYGGAAFPELLRTLPQMFSEDFAAFPAFTGAARRALRTLPQEQPEQTPLLDRETENALRHEREENALRMQLQEAVEAEDYERAAKLRDELKALGCDTKKE